MFFTRFRKPAAQPTPYSVPDGVRVYAVGDIHGRHDLLRRLLERIDEDRAQHGHGQLVFLGDYVDRGTDSRQVIETLVTGQAEQAWVCLKGNHEAMMLDVLDGQRPWDVWLANGGVETLFSYGISSREYVVARRFDDLREATLAAVPPHHLAFLRALPVSHRVGDYFFCHAGIRPGVPLDRQDPEDLLWIRDVFIDSELLHGGRVVHGHTPAMEPEIRPNRINVDTGAYLTNRLSCAVIEADQVRVIHT
ncbi:metallophosphoesterase family protein [Ancylobacter sp. VNQ12]|uniref:metallophosphoesterase family protein n=1 Tax=Ancylobacter sp. VNQ12 TaxID=3400920 RepID=UPI003C11A1F2